MGLGITRGERKMKHPAGSLEAIEELQEQWRREDEYKKIIGDEKERKRKINQAQLLKKYGLTLRQYDDMFEEQHGCCVICGRHQSEFKQKLAVDHNHTTGKVRALLCP